MRDGFSLLALLRREQRLKSYAFTTTRMEKSKPKAGIVITNNVNNLSSTGTLRISKCM